MSINNHNMPGQFISLKSQLFSLILQSLSVAKLTFLFPIKQRVAATNHLAPATLLLI